MRTLFAAVTALLLAVTALLLSGCAALPKGAPVVTMHADTAFTGPERQCLQESANKWSEQTSGYAHISYKYDLDSKDPESVLSHLIDHRVVRWTSSNPVVVETDDGDDYRLLGQVSPKGGIHNPMGVPVEMRLVMDRLQDPHMCRLTTIHELGHVLGLPHIERNPENIMFPMAIEARTACLKPDDLLMFCFVNDCGNIPMKPCPDTPTGATLLIESLMEE